MQINKTLSFRHLFVFIAPFSRSDNYILPSSGAHQIFQKEQKKESNFLSWLTDWHSLNAISSSQAAAEKSSHQNKKRSQKNRFRSGEDFLALASILDHRAATYQSPAKPKPIRLRKKPWRWCLSGPFSSRTRGWCTSKTALAWRNAGQLSPPLRAFLATIWFSTTMEGGWWAMNPQWTP